MMRERVSLPDITRRGFVGGTAMLAGAAIVGGTGMAHAVESGEEVASPAAGTVEEREVRVAGVTNCGGHCALCGTVRDGRIVSLGRGKFEDSDENRENICQRCMSQAYRMYSDRRILTPLRRVGERGEGKFEEISWDEAIAEICEKWKAYRKEYGNGSIVAFGGSGSQADDSTTCWDPGLQGYSHRFVSYMNMPKIRLNADIAGMFNLTEMVGAGLCFWGSDWDDLPNADHIVVWGCNPTESNVARFRHVTQAQEAGATLTVIDPNFTITASKADRYISIRPGSDGLLAIAVMRYIFENNLQDEEFLSTKSVAPFLVKDSDGMYLRTSDLGEAKAGADDDIPVVIGSDGKPVGFRQAKGAIITGVHEAGGVPVHTAYDLLVERVTKSEWTPEQILEYTDLSQDDLDEVCRLFTTGKTTIITGYGPDHYANGHTFYQNVLTLLFVSGNMGKHGAGVCGSDVSILSSMAGGNNAAVNAPADAPGVYAVVPPNNLPEVLETGKFGDLDMVIKSAYIQGTNVLNAQAQRMKWIEEILPKIEFIVVADIVHNNTTPYADLVLPVAHWWELERYWAVEGYTLFSEKVSEPAGEAKGDLEILNLILEGMGMGDKCMTRDEYNTRAFENDVCKEAGITWEVLKEKKSIKTTPENFVFVNGETPESITTPIGRFSFYREGCRPEPDIPGQEWDYMKERLPYWEPPHEAWFQNEVAQKFPLQFMTERSKFKAHSAYTECANLLEIMSEPYVTINPADAEPRGIHTGDYVRVFNDRGSCVARALLNNGNRPGIVQIDHGWAAYQFKEGHYQNLTSSYTGNVFSNNCYHDTLVDVEKA